MLLCKFGRNNVCKRCGRVNASGVKTLRAHCRATCVHLGESVGEIKVECDGCRGRVMLKECAHACAAFGPLGRCLPAFVPGDLTKWQERPEAMLYHLCHGCELFTAAATPPSSPQPPA